MNSCKIEYVGKSRNGKKKYWCSKHKEKASDKDGCRLEECLNEKKKDFDDLFFIPKKEIENITLVFPDLLKSKDVILYVNHKEVKVLQVEDSCLEKKDFIGLLLSKLNQIPLEKIRCHHCGRYHNDNYLFAITPHRKHLCLYCGHEFYEKYPNIGNELICYISIPPIKLSKKTVDIKEKVMVSYHVLTGELQFNNISCDKIILNDCEVSVKDFINDVFI